MNFPSFSLLAALLVALTAFLLLIIEDWRIDIVLLAAQYLGVFMLVSLEWPLAMAATKLVAGWIGGAVLGMAWISLPRRKSDGSFETSADANDSPPSTSRLPIGRLFFLLATILVGLAVYSQVPLVSQMIPGIEPPQAWGGLILIGLGLLKLGFNWRPMPVTLGLLTVVSGFEILYAAMDITPLVAGLFASITLGLALVGGYLLVSPTMEEEEE